MFTYLLGDIATDTTLLDLSSYATMKRQPRLSRMQTVTLTLPSDTPGLLDTSFDGKPNLSKGTRCIKVYNGATFLANAKIFNNAWGGDENMSSVVVTAYSGLRQLLARTAFLNDTLADFSFPSPTTGAAMLQAIIDNSVTNEDLDIGSPAVLPIDYTGGSWTSTVDLAAVITDTPITIGDIVSLLSATGVLDIMETPVDTSLGADPGILSQLNAVDRWGSDLSATVHFDYGTGLFNVKTARRIDDIDNLCNRLTYELGPKATAPDHWQGNIVGTELTPVDLSAWQADQLASRALYGTFADVRVFDSTDENNARPLFHRLWKTESTFRVFGRDEIFITPAAIEDGFIAGLDYDVGDSVGINAAAPLLGPAIVDAVQRIYGYDEDVGADGVQRISELQTSATGQ